MDLRELAKPLSTPAVPANWKGHSWLEISQYDTYKKDENEEPGNYRFVGLASVLEKVMDQIILSAITWNVQDS